jgi:protein-S-isoprenylcysteine O-methyltransferase Ste14
MPAPSPPSRMRLTRAAVGSAGFLLLAPGVVAGLVPWSLTDWQAHGMWLPGRAAGVVLIAGGAAALLHAFARFVIEGIGTPAPAAPTERLVVGGLYRYVRNPMYLAVGATILGQSLLLGQPVLVIYAGAFAVAVTAFVYGYEEPTLARRFGDQYAAYRSAVPPWLPRLHVWKGVNAQKADHRPDDPHRRRPGATG